MNMFDQIKRTVAFLYASDLSKERKAIPIGTAFFLSFDTTEIAGQGLERSVTARYLFTARHVVQPHEQVWVSMNVLGEHGSGATRAVYAPPRDQWIMSNDADVAVLDWSPDEHVVEFMCVPENALATREIIQRDEITEGSEVFFVGLFVPFVGKRRNHPIVRSGRVALFTDELIRWVDGTWRLHLVEADCFPGTSGSPVFIRRTEIPTGETKLYLLGLMKGAYQHRQYIQGNGDERILTRENMGIAAVVPADDIVALLHSPPMVERQKAALERLLASGTPPPPAS